MSIWLTPSNLVDFLSKPTRPNFSKGQTRLTFDRGWLNFGRIRRNFGWGQLGQIQTNCDRGRRDQIWDRVDSAKFRSRST